MKYTVAPYNLNAVHYCVISLETKGIDYCINGLQFCLENEVPFLTDSFGKTPLEYALDTQNRRLIDKVYSLIYK